MKNRIWVLALFVISALSMSSCSKSEIEDLDLNVDPTEEMVEFMISASDEAANNPAQETRTYLDAAGKVYWHNTDQLNVYELSAQGTQSSLSSEAILSNDAQGTANRIADFTVSMKANTATDLTYFATYGNAQLDPQNGMGGGVFKLSIPATQTPAEGSFDPQSDILVSTAKQLTKQPVNESLRFAFDRINAFAQLTIRIEGLAQTETLQAISFKTTTANIAGEATYNATDKSLVAGTAAAKEIVLDATKLKKNTEGNFLAYISLLPTELNDYTLTVKTSSGAIYSKTVDRKAKPIVFASCNRTKWGVRFTAADKQQADAVYTLVKDASTLKAGDEILIVGHNTGSKSNPKDEYAALGAQNTKNYRDQVLVTVTNESISDPATATVLTLEAGSTTSTWAFKDGANYLQHTGSNNTLTSHNPKDATTSWTIEIDATGACTITNTNIETNKKTYTLQYYKQSGSERFNCYATKQVAPFIYRKTAGGSGGDINTPTQLAQPVLEQGAVTKNSLEVQWAAIPDADNYTVVCKEGTTAVATQESIKATKASFADLKPSTEYTIEVVANPVAGSVAFTKSQAGTLKVSTLGEPTPLTTPELTTGNITHNSIVVNWTEDTAVASYLVTVIKTSTNEKVMDNASFDATKHNGVEITNLEATTEYRIEVVATPQNAGLHTNSTAATIVATTTKTPVVSQDFVKISSLAELGDGGEIVIVYHGTSTFGALEAKTLSANTHATAPITGLGETTTTISEADAQGKIWTITKNGTGNDYTISFTDASTTNYLVYGGSSTQIKTDAKAGTAGTAGTWTASVETNNIVLTLSNGRHLGCASSDTGKIGAYTSTYDPVWIFKRGSNGGGSTPTPEQKTKLATPQVTATATGTTINVNWGAIAGAKNYTVKCGTQSTTATTNSASFTVANNQSYTISVVAHPTDTTKNSDSDAGTATVTVGKPTTQLPTYFATHTGWPELPAMDGMPENSNRYYYFHHDFAQGTSGVKANDMRNFSFCFDDKYHCSRWVAFPMTAGHVVTVPRTDDWRTDSDFDAYYKSANIKQAAVNKGSYNDGIHSRGHLMASADRKIDTKSTTLATNCAPQYQNGHNAGVWSSLEDAMRAMIPQGDTLFVVTGVHFDETTYTINYVPDKAGLQCGNPTHFYKVLLRKKAGVHKAAKDCTASELETTAYWVEHDYSGQTSWGKYDTYRTTVSDVEQKTGLKFFVNVPQAPKNQNTVWQ